MKRPETQAHTIKMACDKEKQTTFDNGYSGTLLSKSPLNMVSYNNAYGLHSQLTVAQQ